MSDMYQARNAAGRLASADTVEVEIEFDNPLSVPQKLDRERCASRSSEHRALQGGLSRLPLPAEVAGLGINVRSSWSVRMTGVWRRG